MALSEKELDEITENAAKLEKELIKQQGLRLVPTSKETLKKDIAYSYTQQESFGFSDKLLKENFEIAVRDAITPRLQERNKPSTGIAVAYRDGQIQTAFLSAIQDKLDYFEQQEKDLAKPTKPTAR